MAFNFYTSRSLASHHQYASPLRWKPLTYVSSSCSQPATPAVAALAQLTRVHLPGLSSSAPHHLLRCHAIANSTLASNPEEKSYQTISDDEVDQKAESEMRENIFEIKGMFQTMEDGEISASPYDTAWVAMVPSLHGSSGPQFPQCLKWIITNQLSDGSWGYKDLFLAYDRVFSTVACLVALKMWNIGHLSIQRGVDFIWKNINKTEEEGDSYMPIAFEVVFPTLLDDAKDLGIDLPFNLPLVEKLKEARMQKLQRIPMDLLHRFPTTLLHSLEGLHRQVDWKKLLELQATDGSFLFSPASTACALKYTSNTKCLEYLNLVLKKFQNAVPSIYPVDMFEHLWMVDRLERLGISRYFKKEIKKCLDYVYKYWTPQGIAWARESNVFDVDDTAMGFRLLRLHGYKVSPDVFNQFKNKEEFFCFEGQTSQAITGMHNLYRASQVMLPDEPILQEAQSFTKSFLTNKQKHNNLEDKWVISKGLKGEVSYSLKYPWHRSLPRIEARHYIYHYCVDDVWIAKSLYRMSYINNEVFLKLAKADYNACQAYHQKEFSQVLMWNKDCQFDELTFARQKPEVCFFSIAATLFEPEYSMARMVWAMCSVLGIVIDDFYDVAGSLQELDSFLHAVKCWDPMQTKCFSREMKILFMGLYNTINKITLEAFKIQERDISHQLREIVVKSISSMYVEAQWKFSNYTPTLEEYMCNGTDSFSLGPIVQPTLFFLGLKISDDDFMHDDYSQILHLISTIGRLNNDIRGFKRESAQGKWSCVSIFLKENPMATEEEAIQYFKDLSEDSMKSLLKEYLRESKVPRPCKEAHISMAKILNLFHNTSEWYTLETSGVAKHLKDAIYAPII